MANLHSFLWFVKIECVFAVVRMILRDLKNLSQNMVRQSVHLLTTRSTNVLADVVVEPYAATSEVNCESIDAG